MINIFGDSCHQTRICMVAARETSCTVIQFPALLLTLISNSKASGCACSICRQLNEEISGRAEEPLIGEILHFIWIVQSGCIYAVTVLDQEPWKKETKIILAEFATYLKSKFHNWQRGTHINFKAFETAVSDITNLISKNSVEIHSFYVKTTNENNILQKIKEK